MEEKEIKPFKKHKSKQKPIPTLTSRYKHGNRCHSRHHDNYEVIVMSTWSDLDDDSEYNYAKKLSQALAYSGFPVRIVTATETATSSWSVHNTDIVVNSINFFIPQIRSNSFWGFLFGGPCSLINSMLLALWMVIYYDPYKCKKLDHSSSLRRQKQRPQNSLIFICDTHPLAIPILKLFGRFRIILCHNFTKLGLINKGFSPEGEFLLPRCIHELILYLVDDVIVQNHACSAIFHQMFINWKIPKVVYPCIDIGTMEVEEYQSIQKIIPNIARHTKIFVTYGPFLPSSNFELAIDAFETLYRRRSRQGKAEKLQLVIASNYDPTDRNQRNYYKSLVRNACSKRSAADILLMTSLATVSKKTLLTYSVAVLYTQMDDILALPILEAMYVARPVIAIMNAVTEEYLPKKVGYLVNATPHAFAHTMDSVLDNTNAAETCGNKAKIYYSDNFSFGRYSKRVNRFLDGSLRLRKNSTVLSCLECYDQINNK